MKNEKSRRLLTATLILAVLSAWLPVVRASVLGVPVASSFSTSVPVNRQSAITLLGSDPEGTALTYAIASGPSHGALSSLNASTGVVIYTPVTNYIGADSFTYTVTSGGQTSAAGTVTLSVTNAKTRIVDTIVDSSGAPRSGKVTFILTQPVTTPSGVSPVGATVSGTLNGAGQFDVSVYPSRSLTPEAYYQVWFADASTLKRELLGIYEIPLSTVTITLAPYKVTDTNLAARYTFCSTACIASLQEAFMGNTVNSFHGRLGAVTIQATDLNGVSGAGLTGIGSGTGGVINTGSTTIGADSDSNDVGVVDTQTRGLTRTRVNNDGTFETFEGLKVDDADDLFFADKATKQVSVGSPPVAGNRKFYVLQNDTDGSMAGQATGHNAIEVRYDGQQSSFPDGAFQSQGFYGTLWHSASAAVPAGSSLSAVRGNAYARPGSAANNGALVGGQFRVRLEGSNNTAEGIGVLINGLDNFSSAPITTYTGLLIEGQISGSAPGTSYGIRQLGGSSNFLSGFLQVGYTSFQNDAALNAVGKSDDSLPIFQLHQGSNYSNKFFEVTPLGAIYIQRPGGSPGDIRQITVGPADSCGTGFRCLRIPN